MQANEPLLIHVQSEETISPEDEFEDPMEKMLDEIETPVKASPLPVRPGESFRKFLLNLPILQHREFSPLVEEPQSSPPSYLGILGPCFISFIMYNG